MNLANSAVMKILSVDRALKGAKSLALKEETPELLTPAAPSMPAVAQGMLPPLQESGVDMPTVLGGGTMFDALIKGQS